MRKLMRLVEAAELEEMPIANYTTIGDFDKMTKQFRVPADRKLATSPKAIENLHKRFANNRFDFNFIIVNTTEGGRHQEVGLVDQDWLMQNMPEAFRQMPLKDSAINVIYTGNAAAERYPFTPWIIAHRLSHALSKRNGNMMEYIQRELDQTAKRILRQYQFDPENQTRGYGSYGNYNGGGSYDEYRAKQAKKFNTGLRHFYEQLGTFKSARDKNLREPFEFLHECLAQYLTIGKIRLNHLEHCIQTGTGGWQTKQHACLKYSQDRAEMDRELEGINETIDELAEQLENEFEMILGKAVGKIFVM